MTEVEPQVLVFRHGPFANLSYVVACPFTREALAIDPAWDVPGILAAMALNGLSLRAIALSHGHHDHLNGIAELAAATGVSVFAHEAEDISELRAEFSGNVLGLRHEELLPIGALQVRALHTPGHTPESISLLVTDKTRSDEPWFVLTGHTLMVGDLGRTELAASAEEGARTLFRSAKRLKALPDHLEVLPGAYSGSVCGKSLSGKPTSTIGFEKRHNKAFRIEDETAFVKLMTSDIPLPPPGAAELRALNAGLTTATA